MAQTLSIGVAPLSQSGAGTLVLYVAEDAAPSGLAAELWGRTGFDWDKVVAAARFRGRQGQALDFVTPAGLDAERLLILGAGKPEPAGRFTPTAWADRGGSLMAKLMAARADRVSVLLDGPEITPAAIAELAAGLALRHYRFDKYQARKEDRDEPAALQVTLHVADPVTTEPAIADRAATVAGTLLARDLVNEPANMLGPLEFATIAEGLAPLGLEVEVLTPEAMESLGMGALLGVARSSRRPGRLVVMQWHGGTPGTPPLAFVGKGVVFDTGGISIKPATNMENMKGDMGGAAAVTGLMKTLATRKARVNAIGVIGLVENMPDGDAFRPGDVLTAMSGTTIEIISTDAEGRLVLADALWYTQRRFQPQFMIDLATLTGAIVVTLGHDHAGLFSNNDDLSDKLIAAGLASGEKLWRLPMAPAYDKMIESRFADIKNSAGRSAGSITAAHFVRRFVNDVPWAHLDIAGTAFGASNTEINTSWGPGFGVALLDRLVRDNYEN